jgi:RNA polymerase sigma-70 factor (ECF subfamily)
LLHSIEEQFMNTGDERRDFEQLVGECVDDLFRFGLWLTRDREATEDVLQETLLRAWRSRHSLKDAKAVKSWLITTFRRENARRFERKQLPLTDIDDHEPAGAIQPAPDSELESNELRREIARLPIQYREPLVLQALMGCSIGEIAEQLSLSESAAMTRVFRARQRLRARLESAPQAISGAPPVPVAA